MRARRPIRAVRPAPGAGPVPGAPRDRRRSYGRATSAIPVGLMTWADGRSPPRIGDTRDARLETSDHLLRPPVCRSATRIDGGIFGCSRRHTNTPRSEEHTSELQSLMRISYAVFCLKKKQTQQHKQTTLPDENQI